MPRQCTLARRDAFEPAQKGIKYLFPTVALTDIASNAYLIYVKRNAYLWGYKALLLPFFAKWCDVSINILADFLLQPAV